MPAWQGAFRETDKEDRVAKDTSPLVCIVDDDASVRKALRRLMLSVGLKAEVFASVEEFLGSSQLNDATCLIADVVMPAMGGLDLQRELISMGKPLPMVFITAHDDDHARRSALARGAIAFLRKPFSEEALLDAVRSVPAIGRRGVGQPRRKS